LTESENTTNKDSVGVGGSNPPSQTKPIEPRKVKITFSNEGWFFRYGDRWVGPFTYLNQADHVEVAAQLSGLDKTAVEEWGAHPGEDTEKWAVRPKDVWRAVIALYHYEQEPEARHEEALSPLDKKLKASLLGMDAFSYFMRVLGKTVKRDEKAVGLELLHMLSAYAPEPANIGVEAPTSEGKTYPAVQVATLFPKEDVWMLGGLSPTALAHDYGVLVDKDGQPIEEQLDGLNEEVRAAKDPDDKADLKKQMRELLRTSRYLVDLEGKILVFLEDPNVETWAKLRPILSHDVEETTYKFTDRQSRGAPLRQVTVVLRGWPVAVYFRAAEKASQFWDQMATRFTTISPEMTPEKYREAIRLIAMRKGLPHAIFENQLDLREREHAKAVMRLIKQRLVSLKEAAREKTGAYAPNLFWIPFQKRIGEDFPCKVGRHMRDSARFLTVLQMCAAVNVFSRPIMEVDGCEHIIVTREDYERAVQLYLTESAETIFTGVPAHIIDFFKKVLIPLGAKESFYLRDMVDKYSEVYGKTRSSDTIRQNYLPPLKNVGLIDEEPDPLDKRKMMYRVLRTEVLGEKSGYASSFKISAIFNPETLQEALDELKTNRRSTPPVIRNFDGSVITTMDLYKMHYSGALDRRLILGETEASLTEVAPKLTDFSKSGETRLIQESPIQAKPASGMPDDTGVSSQQLGPSGIDVRSVVGVVALGPIVRGQCPLCKKKDVNLVWQVLMIDGSRYDAVCMDCGGRLLEELRKRDEVK